MIAVGENSLDVVAAVSAWPAPDTKSALEALRLMPGGQVATAAVAAARLGARVRYCGAVGDDEWAEVIQAALTPDCDPILVRKPGSRTRSAVVIVDGDGRRTVFESRDPRLRLEVDDLPPDWVESGRVLMMDGSHPAASLAAAERARAAGMPVVVDLERAGDEAAALMALADVIIAARDFPEAQTAKSTTGEALRVIEAQYHPALVVVTLGEEGALARAGGEEMHVRPHAVRVVDTTGAGDAFRGGFVASWIELGNDAPVEELLRRAALVAALNCRLLGAQAGLPTRKELEQWL